MAAIRTGVHDGWVAAVKLAVGAGLSDVVYCAIAMFATRAIVDVLHDMEKSLPIATLTFQLVVVVVMVIFGIKQMREKPAKSHNVNMNMPQRKPRNIVEWFKSHGPFFIGVGFAVANLANPSFIPALAAMTTFIHKLEWFDTSIVTNLSFALGFGLGNMLWLFTLARLVIANRNKLTQTFLLRIQQVTGVTLIGFGTFYGLRVLIVTKWGDLLRFVFAA